MKIVLEESDIITIIKDHVAKANLLNLNDKGFDVELEVDGDTVVANLTTSLEVTEKKATPSTSSGTGKRRKRKSASKPEPVEDKSEDDAKEEADQSVSESASEPAQVEEKEESVAEKEEEKATETAAKPLSFTSPANEVTEEDEDDSESVDSDTPPWVKTASTSTTNKSLFA